MLVNVSLKGDIICFLSGCQISGHGSDGQIDRQVRQFFPIDNLKQGVVLLV